MKSHPKPSVRSVRVSPRMKRFAEKRFTLDETVSATWFARNPASILLDKRLTAYERLAYCIMALGVHKGSDSVQIGMRLLGASIEGKSAATASRWITRLEECGLIIREKGPAGARNTYRLLSPVFRTAGIKALETKQLDPVLSQQTDGAMPTCGHCKRPVKQLGKTGWCRGCVNDQNRLRQWEAAKVELGPAATEEQIAQHLHIRKLTATWRKVIRRAA